MALLEARDVQMHYQTPKGIVHALNGISFDVDKGEALGIVGESGSGKTSLALLIFLIFVLGPRLSLLG